MDLDVWIDSKSLQPGMNWKQEISKQIREAKFFVAVISSTSLSKRGYVQKELKYALDVLGEIPSDGIFIIPVRADQCFPVEEELRTLNWVDLFPSYEVSIERLVDFFKNHADKNEIFRTGSSYIPVVRLDFTPYSSFNEFIRFMFSQFPSSSSAMSSEHAYYIKINTKSDGLVLPDSIKEKLPDTVVLVIQNQFKNLRVLGDGISVEMWFSEELRKVYIPYLSIIRIDAPSLDLSIRHEVAF